jgi:hypothetical protein
MYIIVDLIKRQNVITGSEKKKASLNTRTPGAGRAWLLRKVAVHFAAFPPEKPPKIHSAVCETR